MKLKVQVTKESFFDLYYYFLKTAKTSKDAYYQAEDYLEREKIEPYYTSFDSFRNNFYRHYQSHVKATQNNK